MFQGLSSYTKFLLCLLVSAGLHVGAVIYSWLQAPVALSPTHGRVQVALVEVSSVTPSLNVEIVRPQSVVTQKTAMPSAPPTKPLVQKEPTNKLAPVKKRRVAVPAKPLPKPAVERSEPRSAETVCVVSEQSMVENPPSFESHMQKVLPQSALPAEGALIATSFAPQIAVVGDDSDSEPGSGVGTARLVEATPNYRSNPLPEYPFLARQKHWEGVVWLQVDVSAEGEVTDLQLERSCGYKLLDRSASRAVRRWQFTPASRAGVPVESHVRIPVRFRLEDS